MRKCCAVAVAGAILLPFAESAPQDQELRKELEDERRSRKVEEAAALAAIANVSAEMKLERRDQEEITSLRPQLAAAREELARQSQQIKDLQMSLGRLGSGPLAVWLVSCPFQWPLAIVTGLVGLVGLLGPDGLVAAYHSVVGCFFTGLLLASCATFVASNLFGHGCSWLDASSSLLSGSAYPGSYLLWAGVTGGSLLRWRSKVPFVFFASVETLHLQAPADGGPARGPLLAYEAPPIPPPPTNPPP